MMKRMGLFHPCLLIIVDPQDQQKEIHFIVSSLDFGTFDIVSIILQHIKLHLNLFCNSNLGTLLLNSFNYFLFYFLRLWTMCPRFPLNIKFM
jgi:hypothetical protein